MLNNIKNKMSQLAGNEVLGETLKEKELKEETSKTIPKKKVNKESNPRPAKKKRKPRKKASLRKKKSEAINERRPSISRKELNIKDEEVSTSDKVVEKMDETKDEVDNEDFYRTFNAVEGYEDVLSMLAVKETIETDGDFSSGDMDYIEFSQTQPIGLNHEEVTDFISRMKYTLHKLESALKQRDRDIVKVASEVKKVEQKMVERNQEEELERMIGGMTEEERLIEENMELKVEINELVNRVRKMSDSNESSSTLNRQIEALQAENDMLRMGSIGIDFVPTEERSPKKSLPYIKEKSNKLPSFGDKSQKESSGSLPSFDSKESIEDMIEKQHDDILNDVGGFYDE